MYEVFLISGDFFSFFPVGGKVSLFNFYFLLTFPIATSFGSSACETTTYHYWKYNQLLNYSKYFSFGEISKFLFRKWPKVKRTGKPKICQFEISSTFNMILSRLRLKLLQKYLLYNLLMLTLKLFNVKGLNSEV